jgi:hypothetical protein
MATSDFAMIAEFNSGVGGIAASTAVELQQKLVCMDDAEMYKLLGECARQQGGTLKIMHAVVLALRQKGVKLTNEQEEADARRAILRGYPDGDITRYMLNLRNLLTMPPNVFDEHAAQSGFLSITWLPKQQSWYNVGDEVDLFWGTEDEDWWHAVVVGVRQNSKKPICVHWVGYKVQAGKVPNPSFVSKYFLRAHETSAKSGQDTIYTVEYIKKNCIVAAMAEQVVAEASADSDSCDKAKAKNGSEANAAGAAVGPDASVKKKPVAKATKKSKKGGGQKHKKKKDFVEEANPPSGYPPDDAAHDGGNKSRDSSNSNDGDDGDETDTPSIPRIRPPCKDSIPNFGKGGTPPTAKCEQFYWSMASSDTEFCIQSLEALQAGRRVEEDFVVTEGYKILKKRCYALYALYGNHAFEELYFGAVAALESYEGQESPVTSGYVTYHLQNFGFYLTPRMWLKSELLMLMCILVDNDLKYTSINQKDGKEEKSQNRSMACLPVRVQRVIYDRLQQYYCVPDNCISRDYGGVALCSGGSYKSYYDWFYAPMSHFEAELGDLTCYTFAVISGAPDALSVNGPYVRTTDMFNGHPVYAQLNAVEFAKFKLIICDSPCTDWLKGVVPKFLKASRTGERLLVRNQDNNAWIVQSVSAYKGVIDIAGDCGFHVLVLKDDAPVGVGNGGTKGPQSECFKGVDWKHGVRPTMQPCSATLSWKEFQHQVFHNGSQFVFSFGSQRCAANVHQYGRLYRPASTRPQQFHTDGPIDYASIWTSTSEFNMEGSESGKRCLPPCQPDSWSLSALCAFFDLTGIGVPRADGTSMKLDISMGRSTIFRFDFIHHGWKCGEEDDVAVDRLPVHFRAHFYMLGGALWELPVPDFESALEFLCCLSHGEMDTGTSFLLLECLQTFVPEMARPTDISEFAAKQGYTLFETETALQQHLVDARSLRFQCTFPPKLGVRGGKCGFTGTFPEMEQHYWAKHPCFCGASQSKQDYLCAAECYCSLLATGEEFGDEGYKPLDQITANFLKSVLPASPCPSAGSVRAVLKWLLSQKAKLTTRNSKQLGQGYKAEHLSPPSSSASIDDGLATGGSNPAAAQAEGSKRKRGRKPSDQ